MSTHKASLGNTQTPPVCLFPSHAGRLRRFQRNPVTPRGQSAAHSHLALGRAARKPDHSVAHSPPIVNRCSGANRLFSVRRDLRKTCPPAGMQKPPCASQGGLISWCRVGRQVLPVVSSATAYRSGGDGMSNVELLGILLSVAGLVVGVISLTIALKR